MSRKKTRLIIKHTVKYLCYIIIFLVTVPYFASKHIFPNISYFFEKDNIKEYEYLGIEHPLVVDKDINETPNDEVITTSYILTRISGYDVTPNLYGLLFTSEDGKDNWYYLEEENWKKAVKGMTYEAGVVEFKINNSYKYCSITDAKNALGDDIQNNDSYNAVKLSTYLAWKDAYRANVYEVLFYYIVFVCIFCNMYKKDHNKKELLRTN